MSYSKQNWINNISSIDAIKMNHIENGIYENSTDIANLEARVDEIVENGSTTTGNYIKYEDGTLIQYGKATIQSYNRRTAGGLTYWSQYQDITLPYYFLDNNFCIITNVELGNMNIFCQSYGNIIGTNSIRISYLSTVDEDQRIIDFFCIGRWK